MEENKNIMGTNLDKEKEAAEAEAARVKVLSPTQLVMKRFFRNKLAIVGLTILVIMFVFSFVCALFSPYSTAQVFRKYDEVKKDYATAIYNNETRYVNAEGEELPNMAKAQMILAQAQKMTTFEYDGQLYCYAEIAPAVYNVGYYELIGNVSARDGKIEGADADIQAAFDAAKSEGKNYFAVNDDYYVISTDGRSDQVGYLKPIAIGSATVFDYADASYAAVCENYGFRLAAEAAVENAIPSFEFDGVNYEVSVTAAGETGNKSGTLLVNGTPVVDISNILISAKEDEELGIDFKSKAREAILSNGATFSFTALDDDGTEVEYFATTTNGNIYIKRYESSELLDTYAAPSKAHILGTDQNAMDLMTRLMSGGRISLLVGFVVIFIELFIGIIIGGISGYFGGAVDMALMRFVDLFNSIPYWPMLIIAGSVMDSLKVNAYVRLFFLMFIMGFLGWTGIARIVRGQILTLREQEFMIACEANGIRTSRRIFRHLVPNVMPLLIVNATMGLGSVIISEATLSFLGLGAKYPMASWGTIIQAGSDLYVMTNNWWIWVPAGLCILVTVLGFNFVGDGLRDAFDPKMKR